MAETALEHEDGGGEGPGRPSRLALALLGGTVACLVGAGALLWSRNGAAVFSDVVLAAIAWCF